MLCSEVTTAVNKKNNNVKCDDAFTTDVKPSFREIIPQTVESHDAINNQICSKLTVTISMQLELNGSTPFL